jgi:uncharacterized protein (TIGR03437 family)
MRSLRTARLPGGVPLASILLSLCLCMSAFADVTVTVDGLGNGTLVGPNGTFPLPGVAAADPGPGGAAAVLAYGLLNPPDLVFGDVQLVSGGVVVDVLRFNAAGTGNPAYVATMDVYSAPDANTHLVQTPNPPTQYYANVVSAPLGVTYTPGPGQPGYVSVQITHYVFSQVACSYTLNPANASFGSGGGTGSFLISTQTGCPVAAPVSQNPFLTFAVVGNTVNFSVTANPFAVSRLGTITVGTQIFSVVETAPPQPTDITIVPLKLQFNSSPTVAPPSQSIAINGGDGQSFTATSNQPWVTVTSSTTMLPAILTVKVAPDKLAPGSVNGAIITIVTQTSTNYVLVTYIVQGLPSLVPVPAALTFNYVVGGAQPASQTLKVSASTLAALAINISGSSFVSVSPSSGTTPQLITVSVDPSKVGVGSSQSSISITATGVTNSPLVIPVTLNVSSPGPQFNATNVVNGASFQPGPLAPGSLFTVFGSGLTSGGATSTATPDSFGGALPDSLGGVSMTIGGIPVPISFVSGGQINAQIPFEVNFGVQDLVVTANGVSRTVQITLAAVAPGTFQANGRGAILNQDSTVNGPGNAARSRSTIQVFLTGLGAVSPNVNSGFPASLTQIAYARATVTATIGSQPAAVGFAGLAPGFIGLGQANIQVPDLPSNDYSLVVSVNGQPSNPVIVAVQSLQ